MIDIKFLLLMCVLTFLISYLIIYLNKKLGSKFLDSTVGVQKFHIKPTSRLGGISIFVSCVLSMFIFKDTSESNLWMMIIISSMPIFIFGLLEDLFNNIKPTIRLLSAFISGITFILLTEYSVKSLNFEIIDYFLSITIVSIAFSCFAIAGVSNSINIIDGFNGLASGSLIIMLMAFSIISWLVNDILLFNFSIIYISILAGFFILNFPKGYIFLGDAGAYFSGFLLAIIAIMLPSRNHEISAWVSFLICLYPISETLFSIFRKYKRKGHHPSKPDSVHLHMLIYRGLARKISKRVNLENYRNPIVSVFLWTFPLINLAMVLIVYKSLYLTLSMISIAFIIYLTVYRKVSLNW